MNGPFVTHSIRFPAKLFVTIQTRARYERRSYSAMVLLLLEKGLGIDPDAGEIENEIKLDRRISNEP